MWPVLLLGGCANPISNELFYADEEFLSAFPSQERVGFSSVYANSNLQSPSDPLLQHVADAASDLDPLLTLITTVSDVLRSTAPSERSDTHRSWSERSMVTPEGSSRELWWIRSTIVRTDVGADFTWTIEGAPQVDGPWVEVAIGRHDPDGLGSFSWDFVSTSQIVGLDYDIGFEADYTVVNDERETQIDVDAGLAFPLRFNFVGPNIFAWTGFFELTNDAVSWPGAAQIFLAADGSGRGEGTLQRIQDEVNFESCWDASGSPVFSAGSADMESVGQPADCTVPDFNP